MPKLVREKYAILNKFEHPSTVNLHIGKLIH